ncbi:hypothetical protein KUCAC02_006537 [Chaenocephalus aceratus]|uniref:Uncharacterized protein n=1 Tax=Chaenocephalus aceratus TaxID=36190 RepID=A0ACB9VTH7_CHAAC|nr:hypothetical protein KUCAC02_006537 [Chaenocephalus aceratus]
MSRIRTTLDTETSSSNNTAAPPETTMKEAAEGESKTAEEEPDEQQQQQVTENPFVATKKSTSGLSSSSSVATHTSQLFHPAALSSNMDETYATLALHINSYFGTSAPEEEVDTRPLQQSREGGDPVSEPTLSALTTKDHIPILSPVAKSIEAPTTSPSPSDMLIPPAGTSSPAVPATESEAQSILVPAASTKKGFTHYLSYPRPSVQAFVGSYLTPLVPKEKIRARVSVDNQTRSLVKGLQRVNDVKLLTSRVEELSFHILEFPETRGVAIKERVLPCLLRLRQARDLPLQAAVREALALIGYAEPVKGRGIRVLTIDGGGTRGLLALQTLYKLQNMTGKRIHQLFDYICGVSTGAILAFMLGIFQIPLEECEEMYRKLGSDVFKQNVIVGTVKMGWSHAFYDSAIWENILKERMGEGRMIESARDPHCPKELQTHARSEIPLPWRLQPQNVAGYQGLVCRAGILPGIRPGKRPPSGWRPPHQQPHSVAIHECKCLWPNTPLQCVLSLGTGRYETVGKNSTTSTSLKTKLSHVISSATDTEEVHTMLDALLPPGTYFRFNPYMSEDIPLNESRPEKLNFLKGEAERYLERNEAKLKKAASVLCQEKSTIQRVAEWAKLKADMYEGLPFSSKL